MTESPCLQKGRISTLSRLDRGIATAAMAGSLPKLRLAISRVEKSPTELGFLPVFYHLLDPADIPATDEMDVQSLPDTIVTTITAAYLALEGLVCLPLPVESHPDLWVRAWPWMQFLDIHYSRIADAPTEDLVHCQFFRVVVGLMHMDLGTRKKSAISMQISSTPGVGILAAQALGSYYRDPDTMSYIVLRKVTQFLLISEGFEGGEFGEFIEGAGGDTPLANLLVRLIDYVRASDNIPTATAANLISLIAFCVRIQEPSWVGALLSQKATEAIFQVLLFADRGLTSTHRAEAPVFKDLFHRTWGTLLILIMNNTHSEGYRHLVQAIELGVLHLVVSHAQQHIDWSQQIMQIFVKSLLPQATVYYPVLSSFQATLPSLEHQTASRAFVSSALYPAWAELMKVVIERLQIKKKFDSGEYVAYKACDAIECGIILEKTKFKRCAGCRWAHYCSRECQISDWQTEHRSECIGYCTARDRSFLRAIMNHDYVRYKERIFLSRIVQMRDHGQDVPTLWDYSQGLVKIGGSVSDDATHGPGPLRARRMHLNCVNFFAHKTFWMVSVRYSDPRIHDTLLALSQRIPLGTVVSNLPPHIIGEARRLITQVCPEVLEIIY
ncbi:hypothetical protein C8F04DRAFT_1106903 [Mycena alexandri]|uniref:MYND-type domain-containing protein n=1 Tax=Mycena alexandri TaxID=1745969 RepID=A0AAD6X1W5_9AGAR|nr:hypothetical protein C8F04DRAFT_1106903 [Mycena alexandri]